MRVAILGCGDRGSLYGKLFTANGAELTAVCDINRQKADTVANSPSTKRYYDEETFFKAGKIADLLVISTLDFLHYRQTIRAIELGYDVLLEKPIACTIEECREIESLATARGTRIYLCYVLRYAPFFLKIKELIDSKKLGQIASINLTECVGYWHHAHSYVRGNWRNLKESAPMIIAKCSHDLDLLYWLMDETPTAVSSMGSLLFFKEKNAPQGATAYCSDCPLARDCPYNNYNFYKNHVWWLAKTGYYQGDESDETGIKKCLEDKSNPYSRCVFYCDNEVVDHQVTNIEFGNGATAHLTMIAFSADCYRKIHIHGTLGEVYGDMLSNRLQCNIFGKESTEIRLGDTEGIDGHGGGDCRMIQEIVEAYKDGRTVEKNGISGAMCSHYLGFFAEESRLKGGEKIPLTCID